MRVGRHDYVKEAILVQPLSPFEDTTAEKSPDDEKLMDLYWNRNELKKEFADLRMRKFRCRTRSSSRMAPSRGCSRKLDHLEDLLIDPEWARNAAGLLSTAGAGLRCQRKLARLQNS